MAADQPSGGPQPPDDKTDAAGGEPDSGDESGPPAEDRRAARARQRREQRRLELLAASKQVFRERGYHDASVHDIIAKAKVARGTFYLYFRSKQEVFQELLDEFLLLIRHCIHGISLAPGAAPPLDQLRENFRRVIQAILEHDDVATIMLRHPTAFDPESRAVLDRFFHQVRSIMEGSLAQGQKLGLIRDCDIQVVALAGLGGFRETLSEVLHARERGVSSPLVEADHVAHELVRFFLEGLAPPGVLAAAASNARGPSRPEDAE